MKILLDENLDEALPSFMPNHDVSHVRIIGWGGTKNGQLLSKAQAATFELFITADKNMPYQQSMKGKAFALVVLDIHPNVLMTQCACLPAIEGRMNEALPGEVLIIQGPHPRRPGD